MKNPTEEVLKARAERKSAIEELETKRAKAKQAEHLKLLKRVKKNYPKQFAEFNRLKKLKEKYETEKYDEDLHWLQMAMLYGRKWIWTGIEHDLPEFSSGEKKIISDVASKYCESLEKELWAGRDASIDSYELIRLIEAAGVDTYEREGSLWFATTISVHHSTRLWAVLSERREELDVPEELSY